MNSDDQVIRATLQKAQQQADGSAPSFDRVFGGAERRVRDRRRVQFAGAAAVAAIALLAVGLLPTKKQEFTYVDIEALVATTYWSAPSDALLPEHQFDIYREIPQIFESTDTSAGALL
jgi:hypothetical protein